MGVAGELCIQITATRVEHDLRASNDLTIAQLTARGWEIKERSIEQQLALMKLITAAGARDLIPEQQKAIGNALRPFTGRSVLLTSYFWDIEAYKLGEEIKTALEYGGLIVIDKLAYADSRGGLTVGVGVEGPSEDQPLEGALLKSLEQIGQISVSPNPVPLKGPNAPVVIVVGVKGFILAPHFKAIAP